jgi:tryptophanyl-tRNA synthetase
MKKLMKYTLLLQNHQFTEIFRIPQAKIMKAGARIMGLDDPTKKMSKSASSPANYIALTDNPEKATKKIMKAVTDTEAAVKYDQKNKPGISNLLNIYSLLSGEEIINIVKKYEGRGYGDFKKDLAEIVKNFLVDFQKKYNSISDDKVREVLDRGAKKIKPVASETYMRVKKIMGIK